MNSEIKSSAFWRAGIAICCLLFAAKLLVIPGENPTLNIVLALLALAIPVWMFIGWRSDKKIAAIKPWQRRKDWSGRRARSEAQKRPILRSVGVLLVVPLVVALCFGLTLAGLPLVTRLEVLLVLAAAVYFLVTRTMAIIRWHRFGATYFQFDSLPFSPGGTLSG